MGCRDKVKFFVATGGYAGCIPVCPGTCGSLWGVALSFCLWRCSFIPLVLGLTGLVILAVVVSGRAEIVTGKADDPRIVIDEVVGMLIALLWVPFTWWMVLTGFLFFRFFDIVKVFPANLVQRLPGGYGVVGDDIVAGVYANVSLQLLAHWMGQGPGTG